jgi:hypothetical protein
VSKIDARHSGHQVVGDKKINGQFALQKRQCFFGRRGLDHLIAAVAEHIGGANPFLLGIEISCLSRFSCWVWPEDFGHCNTITMMAMPDSAQAHRASD